MKLRSVDTGRLSRLKYKLRCHFKLAADLVRLASGTRTDHHDGVWMSTSRSELHDRTSGPVFIYMC